MLGDDEDAEPCFRVVDGAAASPVILHVPHSSRRVTELARRRILLDEAALSAELDRMTDAYTDRIASEAAALASTRPWMFVNLLSRLVVDPERFPDEREQLRSVGMGAVYTRTAYGQPLRDNDPDHVAELLATYYWPYADAISDLVDARLAACGRAVIIDVHSYPSQALPYELRGAAARPAICLGQDPTHTPTWLIHAARTAFVDRGSVAVNTPFHGCYVPLKHYRDGQHDDEPMVASLMVEIRRDTYLIEPAGPPTNTMDHTVSAVAALLDRINDQRNCPEVAVSKGL